MKKRVLYVALLSAFLASCQIQEAEVGVPAPEITARVEAEPATRTVLAVDEEGAGTISWMQSDSINVFFGKTGTLYISQNTVDAASAVFRTTDNVGLNDLSSGNIWGLYPYNSSATCNGSSVSTTLPAVQAGVPETFDDDLFITLAHSSTTDLQFYNVCSGIKFSLSRGDIKSVSFKGNNNEDLAGDISLTFENDRPKATVTNGVKEIILTPKNGHPFTKGVNYYIVTLPATLSQGFTVTFTTTDGSVGMLNYGGPVILQRAVFSKKSQLDTYAYFYGDSPLKDVESLTYIPDSADGYATVFYFRPEEATVDMKFMISPVSASKPLIKAVDDGILRIIPVATHHATRSLSDIVKELTIVNYSIDPDGLLTVKVDASGLDPGFFKGECGASVAIRLSDGVTERSSAFVPLKKEFTGLEYAGELYHTARMKDGKVWMTDNLRYIPEGYVPCSDLTNVTGGIYMPVVVSDGKAAFGTAEDAETQGYLYQSEVALGLNVGDIKNEDDAKALEGARGICPEGWHIPTLADYLGLVGKSVGATTNTSAPYYDGTNGSIRMLNADGFNLFACGAVTIQDNTKTSGTLMGKLGAYDYISSGYICGSSYAGVTIKDGVMTNVQFFGLMPMTNKATEAEFTANGSKLSYRIAASVRCVKD